MTQMAVQDERNLLMERIATLEAERDTLAEDVGFLKDRLDLSQLRTRASDLRVQVETLKTQKTELTDKLAQYEAESQTTDAADLAGALPDIYVHVLPDDLSIENAGKEP